MHSFFEISIFSIVLLSLAFFIAGFIDSIAGGGGAISLPSLLLAGLDPQMAAGTNKFASTFGTFIATLNFIKHKKLNYKLAFTGIIAALIGSALGSRTLIAIDPNYAIKILIFLLPIGAIITLIPKKESIERPITKKDIFIITPIIAFIVGFYDGFFGPGTGSFLIILFSLFLKIDLLKANALAKAINFASNLASLIVFSINLKVMYVLAIPLVFSIMLGGFIGSSLAIKYSSSFIKIILSGVFISLFFMLLFKYIIN